MNKLTKYDIIKIICIFFVWLSAHIDNLIQNLEIVFLIFIPAIIIAVITHILEKRNT